MSIAPPAPTFAHSYHAFGAAAELMNCREPEVLLAGPAGTGKSRAALEKLHIVCLRAPNTRVLMVRKTQKSLATSGTQTYRTKVAATDLMLGRVVFHGGGPQDPAQYRYDNGSTITVGGLDNPDKVMSTEYDLIYVQEATEATAEDWEKLTTRLRNWNLSYQQLIADCNPDTPTHWLKKRCDQGKTVMLHSRHEDNPTLFDPVTGEMTEAGAAYLAKLDALTGVRRLRLRDGQWVAAEGQIYDEWLDKTHLLNRFEIPKDWPRFWSVDFGFTNPFVLQCWAEDPDGRLYLYREIYHTRRLVEDHAKAILDVVAPEDEETGERVWSEPKPRFVVCDHDAEGRETLKRHLGLPMRNARKDVETGIQAVQKRIRVQGDGKARLFILRDSVIKRDAMLEDAEKPACTAEEVAGYVWDPSSRTDTEKEQPLKENDHGMDALRYLVMHVDRGSNPGIKVM